MSIEAPYNVHWAQSEKKVSRRAFDLAYQRECKEIKAKVEAMLSSDSEPKAIWRIHDYLSSKREETDAKYDYRYSQLIMVFGLLLKQGWLTESDLQGLDEHKIERIKFLAEGTRF